MRAITYYCMARKRWDKQQQLGASADNTTHLEQRGEEATGSSKNRVVGHTVVRRLMLLRVVDQQGIGVVSLSTKERLSQLRRQHVGYTFKLQWEIQLSCQVILKLYGLHKKIHVKLKQQMLIAYLFVLILFTYGIKGASAGVALQFP